MMDNEMNVAESTGNSDKRADSKVFESICNEITTNNTEAQNSTEINGVEDTYNTESETIDDDANDIALDNKSSETNVQVQRLSRLPIARIKNIMKFDDDVHAASQESTFLITKATELFIEDFVKEVYQCTLASKKKTISKRDIDTAIFSHDYFIFLDGALD